MQASGEDRGQAAFAVTVDQRQLDTSNYRCSLPAGMATSAVTVKSVALTAA